jgi:hypothetical protein
MVALLPFFAGMIAGAAAVSTLRSARREPTADGPVTAAAAAPAAASPPAPPPADSQPAARRRGRRPRKTDQGSDA